MPQHSNYRSPRRRRKKKDHEKILEEIIVENFPKMGKEIITQVPNRDKLPKMGKEIITQVPNRDKLPESPKQDKPKVKHPKTHINQVNKDQT